MLTVIVSFEGSGISRARSPLGSRYSVMPSTEVTRSTPGGPGGTEGSAGCAAATAATVRLSPRTVRTRRPGRIRARLLDVMETSDAHHLIEGTPRVARSRAAEKAATESAAVCPGAGK